MPEVWYVAYGSNLALDRFRSYLCGGRPSGGLRDYVGCRDARDPARIVSLFAPGGLVFAGESTAWGGGMAFYDQSAPSRAACRGYLISAEQFADVTTQEMRRPPGGEFARQLAGLLGEVESLQTIGPGHYETIVRLGVCEGAPLLTVTHGDVADLVPTAPSAAYLSQIATGLRETHGWRPERIAEYLAPAPGVHGFWTADQIADVARSVA
jgi:hypothetical protein